MRMWQILGRTACVTMLAVSLLACGSDSSSQTGGSPFDNNGSGFTGGGFDTTDDDAPQLPDNPRGAKPDVTEPIEETDTGTVGSTTAFLEFVEATGDDGQPCAGEPKCGVKVFFNGDRNLNVRYVRDGVPVASGLVTFSPVGSEAESVLSVKPNAAYTESDGTAATKLEVVSNIPSTYEIRVNAGDDPTVVPISFVVQVESKLGPPLIVKFDPQYDKNAVKFAKIETTLWKHKPGQSFSCSSLDLTGELPSGGLGLPKVQKVDQVIEVPTLLGLADEGKQQYTAIALGKTNEGGIRVAGCNDTDAALEYGKSKTVTIALYEVPPDYTGPFEVTTFLDLTSALPPSVQEILGIVFGLFESPAGGLALIACALQEEISALESLCGYVFADTDNPEIGEWAPGFAGIIIEVVDGLLIGLIESTTIGKAIFYTGKDIGQILTDLELHSVIEMLPKPGTAMKKAMPDQDGFFSKEQCLQEWTEVVVKWTLNAGCDPADPSCGYYLFNFAEFSSKPVVVSSFEANVSPTFYDLNISPHSVNFQYGALLNAVIKKFMLPAIFGDGKDGYPKVDEYDEVLKVFMCGKEGLLPQNDCCQMFADDIAGSGGGAIASTIKLACNGLIDLGVGFLEQQLTGLDLDVDNLTMQTASPCKLYDVDEDGRIDNWGKVTEPCMWNMTLNLFGLNAQFDAEFYAVRKK